MLTADPIADDGASPRTRSRVTNGTQRLLFGDQRSAGARRFRDLLLAFGTEVGGLTSLPASDQQLIRRLTQVSVELELLEAQRAAGEAIDPVAFVTLVNCQRRLLRALDRIKAAVSGKRRPNLAEHIASTYGPKTAVPA